MAKPSIVSSAGLDQAAQGNPGLRQILQQLVTAANTQATKTNTSGKAAPNQSAATVLFQNPIYLVTFADPAGAGGASLAQTQQQAANSPLGSNSVQSVLHHQVQAATSVLFDAPSGLRTYGGDSGSLQTQFTIGDLDVTKSWYFRIRTSFDGLTWNQWKTLSKTGTVVNPAAVTLDGVAGGQFAGITLLGQQIVGFGIGRLASGGQIQTARGVLIANSIGIVAPSGYTDTGHEAQGLALANIDGLGLVSLAYTDGSANQWSGQANFLTFGWALGGQNVVSQVLSDGGRWVVLTLAGGSQIAIGSGVIASGATFQVPAGFTAAASMGVCTPAVVGVSSNPAYGVLQATVVNGLVTLQFGDSTGHVWASTANWLAIAWQGSLSGQVVAVAGGKYIVLPTPSGSVAIGVGATASGGALPLPPGKYHYAQCLAFSTPATFQNVLPYAMHGVEVCSIDAGRPTSIGTVTCLYGTKTGPRPGNAAWWSVAWL